MSGTALVAPPMAVPARPFAEFVLSYDPGHTDLIADNDNIRVLKRGEAMKNVFATAAMFFSFAAGVALVGGAGMLLTAFIA